MLHSAIFGGPVALGSGLAFTSQRFQLADVCGKGTSAGFAEAGAFVSPTSIGGAPLGVIWSQYFGSGKVSMDSGFSTILYMMGETHLPCRMSSATSFIIPSWIAQLRPLMLWANSGLRKGVLLSSLLYSIPPG